MMYQYVTEADAEQPRNNRVSLTLVIFTKIAPGPPGALRFCGAIVLQSSDVNVKWCCRAPMLKPRK